MFYVDNIKVEIKYMHNIQSAQVIGGLQHPKADIQSSPPHKSSPVSLEMATYSFDIMIFINSMKTAPLLWPFQTVLQKRFDIFTFFMYVLIWCILMKQSW